MKLRAYFWKDHEDNEYGVAVVAKNSKEAKRLAYDYWACENGVEHDTWIEQRIKWQKDANIDGLKEGVVDPKDGLRRNIYGWLEDEDCDNCGSTSMLYHHNGKALCDECSQSNEKMEEKDE